MAWPPPNANSARPQGPPPAIPTVATSSGLGARTETSPAANLVSEVQFNPNDADAPSEQIESAEPQTSSQQSLRKSGRERTKPSYLQDYVCAVDVPKSKKTSPHVLSKQLRVVATVPGCCVAGGEVVVEVRSCVAGGEERWSFGCYLISPKL
nr:uncharacterized protein LOC109178841 [Ipomoea trifida]